MDIVVKGRNVEVPDHYREHVGEKLARLERYDRKTIRADVELFHERNPRQAKNCQRVEITVKGRGPAVRAEAAAADFYAALDSATAKLENRLRRMHDRRKVHYGKRNPISVAEATAGMADRQVAVNGRSTGTALLEDSEETFEEGGVGNVGGNAGGNAGVATGPPAAARPGTTEPGTTQPGTTQSEPAQEAGDVPEQRLGGAGEHEPGRIVREKEHTAEPMTIDQALYQMELVGHDFYLFSDVDSGRASVVYRRRGFDYGVIRLAS